MIRRALVVAMVLLPAIASGQPTAPPTEQPPTEQPAPIAPQPPPPPPPPPMMVMPPPPPVADGVAPSCVAGPQWYVETGFLAGTLRARSTSGGMTFSGTGTRVGLSAATGLLYRACSAAGTPGVHLRFGAYFEAREALPIGVEAQVDLPSGGSYRLGGRIAAMKAIDDYNYAPFDFTAGFRARRGILVFGIDGLYTRYSYQYDQSYNGTSYGLLVVVGIQARPDAD